MCRTAQPIKSISGQARFPKVHPTTKIVDVNLMLGSCVAGEGAVRTARRRRAGHLPLQPADEGRRAGSVQGAQQAKPDLQAAVRHAGEQDKHSLLSTECWLHFVHSVFSNIPSARLCMHLQGAYGSTVLRADTNHGCMSTGAAGEEWHASGHPHEAAGLRPAAALCHRRGARPFRNLLISLQPLMTYTAIIRGQSASRKHLLHSRSSRSVRLGNA